MTAAPTVWHDLECGSYSEDLPLWEELAAAHPRRIAELGAGTGRVALHLARRGHAVEAIERDAALAAELRRRAAEQDLGVVVREGDVRELVLGHASHSLVLCPMQLIQQLGGHRGRAAALRRIAACLAPGGVAAFAIVEGGAELASAGGEGLLPDVRERDSWVYSSLPLDIAARNGHLEVRRLRQEVSPDGELTESRHTDVLEVLDGSSVERDGAAAGLASAGRREIGESDLHVGSTVVLLRKEA